MYRSTIRMSLICILLIYFNQHQVTSTHLSAFDETENRPFSLLTLLLFDSWYNQLNDVYESEPEDHIGHLRKRFSSNLLSFQRGRYFGNTRYGRNLPYKLKEKTFLY